jgi:hypothetical protein
MTKMRSLAGPGLIWLPPLFRLQPKFGRILDLGRFGYDPYPYYDQSEVIS